MNMPKMKHKDEDNHKYNKIKCEEIQGLRIFLKIIVVQKLCCPKDDKNSK